MSGNVSGFDKSMINYSAKDGILTFQVRVVPRASRSEIVGEHDGALRVRVAAPPVDGAANEELVRLLARKLGVSRNAIMITGGHTAKLKQLRVTGASSDMLALLMGKQPGSKDGC
jgi:uncharacterized protein (TIGR00251 family)